MKTVYKYPIELPETTVVGTINRPLMVAEQSGKLCVWVEHDTECALCKLRIKRVGTGDMFDKQMFDCGEGTYLATIQRLGYVWHFYYAMEYV